MNAGYHGGNHQFHGIYTIRFDIAMGKRPEV